MNIDSLKNCIVTLEKLRDATDSQSDTRVLWELEEVIAELKKLCENHEGSVKLGSLSLKTLEVIGQVISLVSNITDLMK
jgi:urease accessory protein UreF